MKWWWSRERRIVDYEFNRLLRYYADAYKNHQVKPGEWIKMCNKQTCCCAQGKGGCTRTAGSVDWSKPIQTMDGRKARLLGDLNKNTYPRACAIMQSDGHEYIQQYTMDGYVTRQHDPHISDIINVPEKMVRPVYYSIRRKTDGANINGGYVRLQHLESEKSICFRLISDTTIPESLAKQMGFKEWIDA